MSGKNPYRYLNAHDPDLFYSKLSQEIAKAQEKAPPAQWAAFINGLTTKGVKGIEIEESGILNYLTRLVEKSVTKSSLIEWLKNNTPTIKEIHLQNPKYSAFQHIGNDSYTETLYVLNTQADNIQDRLEDIRFELEELDFDLGLLASDPERAIRLANEQMILLKKSKEQQGHGAGHYANINDTETGEEIRNVLGHCRHARRGDLYFLEEVQSDWAQRGRKSDWKTIPRAPFVTNTEAWAALIIKRQIQAACTDKNMNKFSWIRGYLRNGRIGDPNESSDGLDNFYMKILPKIIDKLLAGTGEKVKLMDVRLKSNNTRFGDNEEGIVSVHQLPGFDITDKVREKMLASQPLYSRDLFANEIGQQHDKEARAKLNRELKSIKEMLGSCASVRLAAQVLDASGQEVAGRQVRRLVQASLSARDPALALAHEAWHYAYRYLIGPYDREAIDRAFQPGSKLNKQVRAQLLAEGATDETIRQCDDVQEASAHGFSLWKQGKLKFQDVQTERDIHSNPNSRNPILAIFTSVSKAFHGLSCWVKNLVGMKDDSHDVQRASDVFTLLASKRLAQDKSSHDGAPDEEDDSQEGHQVVSQTGLIRPRAA